MKKSVSRKKSQYRPKSKINKQIQALELSLTTSMQEYSQLHEDLKAYTNRRVDSDEEWDAAMKIITDIQNKFMLEIAPVLNYIHFKYSYCTRAGEGYQLWVDTLKKAGLVEEIKPSTNVNA